MKYESFYDPIKYGHQYLVTLRKVELRRVPKNVVAALGDETLSVPAKLLVLASIVAFLERGDKNAVFKMPDTVRLLGGADGSAKQ